MLEVKKQALEKHDELLNVAIQEQEMKDRTNGVEPRKLLSRRLFGEEGAHTRRVLCGKRATSPPGSGFAFGSPTNGDTIENVRRLDERVKPRIKFLQSCRGGGGRGSRI